MDIRKIKNKKMAVEAGTQFVTYNPTLDLSDKASALINKRTKVYTIEEVSPSFPEFTTKTDEEVQVGTVINKGKTEALFYQKFKLDVVSGNTDATLVITAIPNIQKTNIIISLDEKRTLTTVTMFVQDPPAYAEIIPDAEGMTEFRIKNQGKELNGSYSVIFELWYTKGEVEAPPERKKK
jgi:hypothetical protein